MASLAPPVATADAAAHIRAPVLAALAALAELSLVSTTVFTSWLDCYAVAMQLMHQIHHEHDDSHHAYERGDVKANAALTHSQQHSLSSLCFQPHAGLLQRTHLPMYSHTSPWSLTALMHTDAAAMNFEYQFSDMPWP